MHSRKKLQKKETSAPIPKKYLEYEVSQGELLGEAHWLKPSTLARHYSNHFRKLTGGPGKEHGTNKPPPTERVQKRSKGDAMCPNTSQNLSCCHSSWLSNAYATRKDLESEWLAKENPETNPITIKAKAVSHVAEQSFWVPLPSCWAPLPNKASLSACMSSRTVHFECYTRAHSRALKGVPLPAKPPCCLIYFNVCMSEFGISYPNNVNREEGVQIQR